MRNMSFMLTTKQFRNRTKTVTRRLGWRFARAGDVVRGVEKCQGLKKGESMVSLGVIRFTDVRREPLSKIDQDDVIAEGFPGMTPAEFVEMFCRHMKCTPDTEVTRIEYEYEDVLGRQAY